MTNKKYTIPLFIFLMVLAFFPRGAYAQVKIPTILQRELADTAKKDTAAKVLPPRSKIKSYATVVTKDFVTQKGLFTVHKSKTRDLIYFEIPDSILHRDLMVINRLSKAPGGLGMYPGEELDEKTIQFEVGPDSTVRVRYDLIISQADSDNVIYKAVVNANYNPVVMSFPILAYGKTHKSYVVDVTRLLKEKGFVNSIDPGTQLGKNVNLLQMRDVRIEYIHAYPLNVEVSISKTTDSKKTPATPEPVTLITNTSFVELPKVPLQRRFFDPRVGYFADNYHAYSDNQQKSELKQFILRWRLEPKDVDLAKWKRGELVEPKKPIVIYIDPATPKQWRPYLILGINDWQKAFEQAGFKNAIQGKEWPEADTAMHVDDARYSMINYFPSEVMNAYGPQIHDPRSGEIIQTHIGWYHNVMSLLHSWYMIQAGATDPKARKATFDTDLMGELIRFVSSHEVGHTLGLRHNFGSSSQTPVDSLRSKHYLDAHGHTASIMDYARFNYVAQPEDHIPEADLFPRIGEYDQWAIEWGYKSTGAGNAEEDKTIVNKWIVDRTSKNPRLWFGDGETRKFDPRCQTEDLGDNAMKASTYGIKNLQRELPNLPAWTHEDGGINENLKEMYKQLQDQYFRYMNHVLRNVAGIDYTIKSEEQKGPVYEPTPKNMQQQALKFFDEQLFDTPYWLMNRTVLDKVSLPEEPNFIEDTQVKVLNSLLDITRINKLLEETKQFGAKSYPAEEYIATIHRYIWKELLAGGLVRMDGYRRNLQKSYFSDLFTILSAKDEANSETDASSIIKADLEVLKHQIKQAIPKAADPINRYHLRDLQNRIEQLSNPKK